MPGPRTPAGLLPLVARPIAAVTAPDSAPRFRGDFTLDAGHGAVLDATLRVTALGICEVLLDGDPVGDDVLTPGWSSFEWRHRYLTHDVTARLQDPAPVAHTLAATVGNGWYRGRLGWEGLRAVYGDRLGVLAQLDVTFADGHVQTVATDPTWRVRGSDILADDLYDGQTVDARLREPGWARPGTPATGGAWGPTEVVELAGELVPQEAPPVRRLRTIGPQEVWTSPSGATLVDFGENVVGWVRLRVTGPRGSLVTVRHAEVLDAGELCTRPLRSAAATDRLVLSGADDVLEPTLTFHGFRYAELSGLPGPLGPGDLEAVVISSAMRRTGSFASSHALLDALHANVVRGWEGNAVDVPTDCPQRDERMGWTGDIAVFAPTALFLHDARAFLADWLEDLAAEQRAAGGRVAYVVPDVLKHQGTPPEFGDADTAAVWSDAAVWVPWAMWRATGDLSVLERPYDSMVAHVDRVASLLSPTFLWDSGFQFGDWLDPDASPHAPADAKADPAVVATACAARSAALTAETARLLGRDDEAARLGALADRVGAAFREHYVAGDGTVASDCATVYALALVFDLLDDTTRGLAGDRLATLVREAGHRISTGFAGTPYVLDALTDTGHVEDAYLLLLQTECPSWLYPVTMGATTVWERWDSMLPDGSVNPGEMTSFNHYALGSVADWMHRVVAGLAPAEPGYVKVRVAPRPPTGAARDLLTWAGASLDTVHGTVRTRWERRGDVIEVTVTLPPGVTADVDLPGREVVQVGPGSHRLPFYDPAL